MVIKFKPVFFDKIWGGKKIKSIYGYKSSENCGECWGISAHKEGSSTAINTIYKDRTLKDLFDNESHLFGYFQGCDFPILVKIIDATNDLSVQVHPNNEYAKKENSLGKDECWYILDIEGEARIIIGHKATSKQQLERALKEDSFEELLETYRIDKGDFFYIEAGTLHSICKGTMLLEVQQSSNISYRVYDYKRLQNGKPRELHINKALDVINVPDKGLNKSNTSTFFNCDVIFNTTISSKISHIHGDYIFIIEGQGSFGKTLVKKGDFLMVSSNSKYEVKGNLQYQKTTF